MDFTDKQLKSIYQKMLYARYFGEELNKQKNDQYPTMSIGQEASIIGATAALENQDFVTINHKGHIQEIGIGADINTLMAKAFGRDVKAQKGDKSQNVLSAPGIPGSQFPVACGAAITQKVKDTGSVVLCFGDDVSANSGFFKEAVGLAAELKLPVVFIIENNFSTENLGEELISSIALAYQIPVIRVDGNDAIEVFGITKLALDYARDGEGPIIIEALTSSITIDEFSALQDYNDEWNEQDPILRITDYLIDNDIATDEELYHIALSSKDTVSKAVYYAQQGSIPDERNLTEFLYHT